MIRAALMALLLVGCRMGKPSAYRNDGTWTITSVEKDQRVDTMELLGRDATPDCPVDWSIRKLTLHGGKQEGVDVLTLDNGKIRIAICPTRGMGILGVAMGDLRLGWTSPVKEVVHPRHIDLGARGGLGWLEGFNEWMCRCGAEWAGHPGTDSFVNNVGDQATMDLTLHGKLANTPASEVEIAVDPKAPHRIRVRGRVDERMFYGPKLELWTEVSTEPGSTTFRISDVLTNRGASEQEYQMIYHANYGRPLLEEGARFAGAVERVTPFNDHAATGASTWTDYAGPKLGFVEQVYCVRPLADPEGRALVMLRNRAGDRGASMSWKVKSLPFMTLWKNTNAEEEGYVTGLEPGTGFPYNRRLERKAGRVPKLKPGGSVGMAIDVALLATREEVAGVESRIASIQGSKVPQVDAKPDKPE